MTAKEVEAALQAHADAKDAVFLQRYFKTGEGEYGAGDTFIGIRVPAIRAVCKKFKNLSLIEIEELLGSHVHEYRVAAVILLANQFAGASNDTQKDIFDTYVKNVYSGRINNWDIVDISAEFIMGEYLKDKPRDILFELAKSDSIWQRRVAILSAFQFVKAGDATTTLALAEVLFHDSHDLIQKAVGWMLREVGKRCDETLLITFLEKHAKEMPRTMLRYAIERLSPTQKTHFMQYSK